MKLMQFLKALMFTVLVLSPLSVNANDDENSCEKQYDACIEKCDQTQEGSEKCYTACDKADEKCIILSEEKE